MPLTRTQIKAAALDLLGEDEGTPGPDRAYLLDTWVNTAADEIARATDCYYSSVTFDLVGGQSEYPAPQVYKVKGVSWTDSTGQQRVLSASFPAEMDSRGYNWRNDPAGDPRYYVQEGAGMVRLYPTPSSSSLLAIYMDLVALGNSQVSSAARPFVITDAGTTLNVVGGTGFTPGGVRVLAVQGGNALLSSDAGLSGSTGGQAFLSQGGLTVEGYIVPGDSWPLATQNCPLPDRAHLAVVWRVAKYRAIQFPTAMNIQRIGLIDAEYKRALGLLEAEMHRLTDASGHADWHGGGFPARRY